MRHAHLMECTLEPGELLFLPIGWWHYVEGLDASVTMTFTNFLQRNDFSRDYVTYHEL
jgi:ribosomal protein L16 Arg81 hydroxylase